MSTQQDMTYWVQRLEDHWKRPEKVCKEFWETLIGELTVLVSTLNGAMGAKRLIFEIDEVTGIYKLTFDEHELRLYLDRRVGDLNYVFASPSLRLIDEDQSELTAKGSVSINIDLNELSVTTNPELQLNTYYQVSGNDWTLPRQIAELFIQKLVAPRFVDSRFQSRRL